MGYYTTYTITVEPSVRDEVLQTLNKISDGDVPSDSDVFNAKWYDSADHLYWTSKKFPNTLITVEGEGEESGDLWIEYWLNGKVCGGAAKIIYPEYKPSLLKDYEPVHQTCPI